MITIQLLEPIQDATGALITHVTLRAPNISPGAASRRRPMQ